MNIRTQAFLLATLVTLILSLVVWTRRERSRTTLPFFLSNFFLMILGASYVGLKLTGETFFLRSFLAAAVFMLPGYLYLTYSYLFRQNRLLEVFLISMFGVAAVFAVTAFIPTIDTALHFMSLFPPAFRASRIALATGLVALPSLVVIAARLYSESERLLKRRYWGLLVVAACVTGVCAVDQWLGGGPMMPVSMALFQYYLYQTMVRFQSFNLRHAAGRLAVLAASSVLLVVVYGLFFFFLEKPVPILLLFHTFVAAFLLMVMIYDPFLAGLEARTRELVSGGGQDSVRRIDSLIAELSRHFTLDQIGFFLTRRVPETLGIQGAVVYLLEDDGEIMQRLGDDGRGPDRIGMDLVEAISEMAGEPVSMERFVQLVSESYPGPRKERQMKLLNLMTTCRGRWMIPMKYQGKSIGVYIPGDTSNPDVRSASGRVLSALADLAAVRIINARIYQKLRSQDRLATLGEMAASLAHEIRNPLGSMKGAAQYLSGEPLPDSSQEFVRIILDEVERLNGVLTRFIDYARPFKTSPVLVDMDELIRDVVKLLTEGEKPEGVTLKWDLSEPVGAVRVDGRQLRQVLINLVKNAWEAQPDGGEVLVSARRTSDNIIIEVADRGPGIGPEAREKLFMPFFTTKEGGSGLGLVISLRIVQAHDGQITARPRTGGGSRIVVEIPVNSRLMEEG